MKRNIIFFYLLLQGLLSVGQNVGIGTQTPHASAMLEISSTTHGLLAPRMTTAPRNAIASPAKGLLVYDTDFNSLFHYNGSAWANLVGSGGGDFSLTYTNTVNGNTNAFRITNGGLGDAISVFQHMNLDRRSQVLQKANMVMDFTGMLINSMP